MRRDGASPAVVLADHTTLGLGGPAPRWHDHADPAAWPDLVAALVGGPRPFVLGGGSNLLAADAGTDTPVVRIATRGITARPVDGDEAVEVTAQAGEALGDVVAYTVAHGLSGLEFLGGIPGTAGAAPVQNTGAYGQQVADALTALTVFDWELGRAHWWGPQDGRFGYRTSVFKEHPGRWTILSVTWRLRRSRVSAPVTYRHLADALGVACGARPPLAEAAAAVVADRRARGLVVPEGGPDARQAGSVFLNPVVSGRQAAALREAGGRVVREADGTCRASAGWLIEDAGFRPGGAVAPGIHCSSARALTLVARQGATAAGFRAALERLAGEVWSRRGVRLRPEPVFLGHGTGVGG